MSVKLSIITVNLNNKAGLLKTIESVESQIFNDFEFIVIDGGSTDGSLDLIHKKKVISQYISERDRGIYHAMNKGIFMAKGEYLYFLNSGDCFASFEVLSKIFTSHSDTSFICTDFYTEIKEKKQFNNPYKDRDWVFSIYDIYSGYLCHQAFFIKKKMFEKYGYYNEELKVVSDWELFLIAIGVNQESVSYIEMPLVIFNAEGISSTIGGEYIYQEKRKVAEERLTRYLSERLDKLYELEQDQYIRDIVNKSAFLSFLVRIYGKLGRIFKKG